MTPTEAIFNLKTMLKDKRERFIVIGLAICFLLALLAMFLPAKKPALAASAESSFRKTIEGRCDSCSWAQLSSGAYGWTTSPYPAYGGKRSADPSRLFRGWYILDLTDVSETISDATLHIYTDWVLGSATPSYDDVNITKGIAVATSTLPSNEYANVENTIFSDYATFASTSPTGWHNFTLNAAALVYLNTKVGDYAQLVVRSKGDIEQSSYSLDLNTIGFNTNASTTLEAYLSYNELGAGISITSPESGFEATTSFNVDFSYWNADDYERLMILFEDWDAETTCPSYGTAQWNIEYPLYFNSQSKPYFSDYFTGSAGTSTIIVDDLQHGAFRCTRCVMINETLGTMSSELCPDYVLYTENYIPPAGLPQFWVSTNNWPAYYNENVDKWATSTALFNYLGEKVSPILNWVGNFTYDFKNLFSASSSAATGALIGNAIPTARGYVAVINAYFSNLPISEIFIFYILTALVLIILKVVLMIWHFFRG